ncbi:MAG TPA: cyclic peptide export ABC transporter [Candidatus Saccharimonadales bacterium]|nr:cyclic peptide export ABC transporter [Candidatus Saccharimonadales bacterium]
MLHLAKFILRTCRGMLVVTALTALLSGACNAALVAAVNSALNHAGSLGAVAVWGFVALLLGKVLTGYVSQIMLTQFSQRAVAQLRNDLVRKILDVPLRKLEQIGAPNLLVTLTDDVMNISTALLAVPITAVNLAILMGGAAYLGWLDWHVFLLMGVFIVVGALGYRFLVEKGHRSLSQARDEEDKLFSCFRALTEGIKELKLHRERRQDFLTKGVEATTERFQRQNVAAEHSFIIAQSWSHLLFFGLIGLLVVLLPKMGNFSKEALTGYIITILYLMGPLAGVLTSISAFSRASVSLGRVESMGMSLAEQSTENTPIVPEPKRAMAFEELELLNVTHTYRHERDDSHFTLGPIDLNFRKGDLVYLVGGNGSGKSSLAKIICGLYPPESGNIRLNGKLITDKNRDDFRQMFSVIFSDFYLFENLIGLPAANLDKHAQSYLEQLHLSHKVKVVNGALSTTSLSQGQRKRLALMTAYLEDRPFYLFDEWASDQDPIFKEIFYTRLLPDLKARGKTVLVITHDDKYFDLADRIIKLDVGKIVGDNTQHQFLAPALC